MLRWKIFRSKWTAVIWFLIINILFFLPGSSLPQEGWFDKIYIDKWVHVILFASLVFLFRSSFNWKINNWIFLLLCLTYGFLVEVIQREWIPNRSFDLFDVAADMTGSIIGLFIWMAVYKKNKPL